MSNQNIWHYAIKSFGCKILIALLKRRNPNDTTFLLLMCYTAFFSFRQEIMRIYTKFRINLRYLASFCITIKSITCYSISPTEYQY